MSESTKESEEAQRLRVSRLAGFRVLALLRRSAIVMGISAENMVILTLSLSLTSLVENNNFTHTHTHTV